KTFSNGLWMIHSVDNSSLIVLRMPYAIMIHQNSIKSPSLHLQNTLIQPFIIFSIVYQGLPDHWIGFYTKIYMVISMTPILDN
ncbi:hypothetical protein INT45_000960, partial [Circinella minor]